MLLLPGEVNPINPDLQTQAQLVDESSFVHPTGPSNGLQNFNVLSSSAVNAPTGLDPMEASTMGGHPEPGGASEPCKFDLLSSIPSE